MLVLLVVERLVLRRACAQAMGGKTSKGSVGHSSLAVTNLTHHRSASTPLALSSTSPTISYSLSPRRAAKVELQLQLLDQIYAGVAAAVLISKTGDLLFVKRGFFFPSINSSQIWTWSRP